MAFKTPQAIIQAEQQYQADLYRAVAMALQSGHVGEWSSDHNQEAKSYSGWNYLAIAAIGRLAAQAVPYVYSTAKPGASAMRKSLQGRYKGIWKSFADDGAADTVPEEHWVSRLANRPNPSQTRALFQWEYVQQMHLHGACIIFNRPNKDGSRIVQRYIVPMTLTQPVYPGQERNAPNGGIRVMTYAAGLGFYVHPLIRNLSGAVIPSEMLSILRYPHPVLRGDGKSPTDAAGWWIDSALMTDMARWKQLKRGPRPFGVVTVKDPSGGPPTVDLLEQVEKRLNRKLGDESFDQRVLAVGDGTQIPSDTTPKDMDYINAFSQLGQAILAVHGSSKAMVGLTDNMTYGSLAAALRQSASVVQSDMDILGDEYTLLAESYGETVEVQFEVPTYEDPQLLEQQLTNDLQAGVRKGREWRAMRGLPPFGDWRDEARVTPQGLVLDTQPPEQQGAAAAGPSQPSFASFQSLAGDATAAKSIQRLGEYAQGILAKSGQVYENPADALAAMGMPRPSIAKSYRKPGFSWDSSPEYRRPIVAVDLDGTLAQETDYFDEMVIGEPIPEKVDDVRRLKEAGCQICIFTCRDNDDVTIQWLEAAGVPWDAINAQPVGFEGSGKVFADVYWDNRALNAEDGLQAVAKRLPDGEVKRRLLATSERSSDLGCIMLEMPEAVCQMVKDEQMRIGPESLRDEGLEEWPHVTLLYGVVGASPKEVIDCVRRIDQLDLTFGGVSTFDQPDGVAVLKVDIESPAVHKANERLKAALPVQETYPTYIPHMTLAYVDGSSPEALNAPCECDLTGRVARVTHAIVSMDGQKYRVPLRMNGNSNPGMQSQVVAQLEDHDSPRPFKRMESIAKAITEDPVPEMDEPANSFVEPTEPLTELAGQESIEQAEESTEPEVIAAGLAVVARDTGRFLMLQRAMVDGDPAAGKWEFPGGHVEDGEDPLDSAKRVWEEEVGQTLPLIASEPVAFWEHGPYIGFVVTIDSEDDVPLNAGERRVLNPDDPDRDAIDVVAWWRESEVLDNPAIRDELRDSIDAFRAALHEAQPQPVTIEELQERGSQLSDEEKARVLEEAAGDPPEESQEP